MKLAVLTVALLAAPAVLGAAGAVPFLEDNPWLDRRVLNMAHQGGNLEAPSNTMYAFKTAVAKGADVIELDVHATQDGHLVVLHDDTVDRTTDGSGAVHELTLEEVRALDAAYWFVEDRGAVHDAAEDAYVHRGVATGDVPPPQGFTASDFRVPTLREVLETFPDVLVNIEIKNTAPVVPPYEKALADLLHEFGRGDDTIVVSFHDEAVEAFRVHAPEVSTAAGTARVAAFWASGAGPAPGSPARHHALQVPIEFEGVPVVTQDFVRDAHANGIAVHVWTINDKSTMEELVDLGVDGIMTDRPTLLQEVLSERGLS